MKKLLDVLIAIIVLPIYLAILLIKMVFVAFRYLLGLLMGLVVLTFWSVILFPPTGGHDIAYQSHDIDQKCRVSVPATTEPAGKQAVKSRPEDTQLNSYLCPVLLKIHRPQGALTLLH